MKPQYIRKRVGLETFGQLSECLSITDTNELPIDFETLPILIEGVGIGARIIEGGLYRDSRGNWSFVLEIETCPKR